MSLRITYLDKILHKLSLLAIPKQWRFEDANEVKTVVNGHADDIEALQASPPGSVGVVDSTGVKTGGVIIAGASTGEYSLTDGTGQVVTNLGVNTSVSWTGQVNRTPVNIGSALRTYIGIDENSVVVEQTTEFTVEQSRSIVVLGLVVHIDGVSLFVINNRQHIAYNAMNSTYDLGEAIGIFNVNGNVFSGNGVNLSIDKAVGEVFRMGSNYETNANKPHDKTLVSLTLATLTYVFNDNSNGTPTTLIDPSSLDDGAGGLTPLSNNTKWSVQRIYTFTSNVVVLQRGVQEFDTHDDAVSGISGEPYFTASSLKANGLLRGWLVVKKNATDLTDLSQAQFIEAPKFGEGGGSSGGSTSIVDLQTAYNNSVTPQIITDAVRYAMSIQQGSGFDTDFLLELLNGIGDVTFAVRADGCVRATAMDIIHEASQTNDHAMEIDANANGFGDVKALDISYVTGAINPADDESVILVEIDETQSVGGTVAALTVLSSEVGAAEVDAILTGANVNPIKQLSGAFANASSVFNVATDVTDALSSGGAGNITAFVNDNESITISSPNKFEEIEIILTTVASQNINPTFEFSTGAGTWGFFTPNDGTNGFRNTGEVLWLDSNIPSWVVGTGGDYLIRITRTRNNLTTSPILDLLQISSLTEYGWDKDGNLIVNSVNGVNVTNDNLELKNYGQVLVDTTTLTITSALHASKTLSVFGAGAECVMTLTSTSLDEGGTFEIVVGDSDGFDFLPFDADVVLFGVNTGSTTIGDVLSIRRVPNGSYNNGTKVVYVIVG